MECFTDIRKVDGARVALLLDCSIQAYNAFDDRRPTACCHDRVTPPEGFELLDTWSGVDAVFGQDKTVEIYGLVFRSTAAPWHYIFAFRGTDDALDALDDCGVEPQRFVPFDSGAEVPEEVRVESGFNDIYRMGDGGTPSMQQQLFALIDRYHASARPIDEIAITGHSLGAALSQLFTLDVALSRPAIQTRNINFASPRVGNGAFVRFCQAHAPQPILRVQNQYDAVPRLPPEKLGFAHTPAVYLIAFYNHDQLGKIDLKANHSSLNYQAVIACAADSTGGVCVAKDITAPGGSRLLRSEAPREKQGILKDLKQLNGEMTKWRL